MIVTVGYIKNVYKLKLAWGVEGDDHFERKMVERVIRKLLF